MSTHSTFPTPLSVRALARLGAAARIAALRAELADLERRYPDLAHPTVTQVRAEAAKRRAKRRASKPAVRPKHHVMAPGTRRALRAGFRRYIEAKRRAKAEALAASLAPPLTESTSDVSTPVS